MNELAGTVDGAQIMLYYGPDMLRMGLGTGFLLEDPRGDNLREALLAMKEIFAAARKEFQTQPKDCQCVVSVMPVVKAIKEAGKTWKGGRQLRQLCGDVGVKSVCAQEGTVVLGGSTAKSKWARSAR